LTQLRASNTGDYGRAALLLLARGVFLSMIHSCDGKAEFSADIPSMSHDPLEIILKS